MTTNKQIETAAILQMRKDLDEARELLTRAGCFAISHDLHQCINAFLARTDATASNT